MTSLKESVINIVKHFSNLCVSDDLWIEERTDKIIRELEEHMEKWCEVTGEYTVRDFKDEMRKFLKGEKEPYAGIFVR
jgi:hypothetical protein